MRCNICDAPLSKPDFNRDLEQWEPCPTCLEVIADTLGSWTDKPFADEDELGVGFETYFYLHADEESS